MKSLSLRTELFVYNKLHAR